MRLLFRAATKSGPGKPETSVAVKQKNRLFHFDSPLGEDKLLVNSFRGCEQLDELFRFELELVSEDPSIQWNQIVGRNVTVGIRQRDETSLRYFNGQISQFAPIRHEGRLAYYSAEMVPWPWFLTLTRDCVIYQEKTVPEVIDLTFRRYGFRPDTWQMNLRGKHEKWEYCCQYRESSFAFVSRLMEAEGIYYYFAQEKGKHTLVMVDDRSAHLPLPSQPRIRFEHDTGAGVARDEDTIFAASMEKSVRPTKYTLKEFNCLIPKDPLLFESGQDQSAGLGPKLELEMYDYPGEYETPLEGKDYSDLRQEEQEDDHVTVNGSGNCRSLAAGYRFDLSDHPRKELDTNFLITSVTHAAHEGTLLPGTDASEASYQNSFTSIPSKAQYRPDRDTPKAIMRGSQTAFVVGPPGEEVYTDHLGRVKVQFHWDRKGKQDDKSSCWIRVMQAWAGMGYGHIWIPRIGQEVIVDFLEGDPDRPIITGCLYNEDNRPPWDLPANQNWSGVKTRSTKGGQPQNCNELRLDDTRGNELFAMQAEKDMHITVKNDSIETVLRDRHSTVGGEARESIQKDVSVQVGGNVQEKVGGKLLLEAAGEIHIKAGGRIVLESGAGVTFLGSGGSSFIDVTSAGIVAQGPAIWINSAQGVPEGALSSKPSDPLQPGVNGAGGLDPLHDAQFAPYPGEQPVPVQHSYPGPSAPYSGEPPAPGTEPNYEPPPPAPNRSSLLGNPWIDSSYDAHLTKTDPEEGEP